LVHRNPPRFIAREQPCFSAMAGCTLFAAPYSKAVGQFPKTGGFALVAPDDVVCHRRGCRTGNFGAVLLPSDEVSIRPPALTFSTFSATEPHARK
jgi:hypothetical protein